MRVERMVAARPWLAAMMIPVLAVSVFGQATPSSAQTPQGTISVAAAQARAPQTPPAGQQPPTAGQQPPAPPVSPTAPLESGQKPPTGDETAVIQEERTNGPSRNITLQEAVDLALENNLDVKIQRIQPAISDVLIRQARAAWLPSVQGDMSYTDTQRQSSSALQGSGGANVTSKLFTGSAGIGQTLPFFGTNYTASWDATRQNVTPSGNIYNPSLGSNLSFNLTQPVLRNFKTDISRTTYLVNKKNREISDVQLHQQIVSTTAQVRNGYWDLVYARANLRVLQQTLDLARQTLKDNRTRVEVGTMAPIDIVEAQAEVARNEQLVIGAAAQIDQNEDALRALIFNQEQPEFWNINLDTADEPDIPASMAPVDIEAAVKNALDKRTDVVQLRKSLEASEINLKYYRNQIMPTVNGVATYGANATGGLFQTFTDPVTQQPITGESRGFSKVQSALFGLDFPTWTVGVTVAYPLGTSVQKAQLMRYRLQYDSDKLNLQSQELTASTQVRNAGRALNTNRRQVEAARVSRELFERRLEAAQKKFAVGLATSFEVLQAQRDLANARNQELQAIITYVQARVTFETVQEIPSTTGGGGGTTTGTGTTSTSNQPQSSNTGTTNGTTQR